MKWLKGLKGFSLKGPGLKFRVKELKGLGVEGLNDFGFKGLTGLGLGAAQGFSGFGPSIRNLKAGFRA